MTRAGAHLYDNEFKALRDGKVIERRVRPYQNAAWSMWEHDPEHDPDPTFSTNACVEFRVRPEPRECWIVTSKMGGWEQRFSSELEARKRFESIRTPEEYEYEIIHYKEVL